MKFYRVQGTLILQVKVDTSTQTDTDDDAVEAILRYYEKLGFKIISINLSTCPMSVN